MPRYMKTMNLNGHIQDELTRDDMCWLANEIKEERSNLEALEKLLSDDSKTKVREFSEKNLSWLRASGAQIT